MSQMFPWKRALRSGRVWFSLGVMLAFGLVAAFAVLLAPHDPYENRLSNFNLPPMWQERGSAEFPLGTDRFGRDIYSRLLHGTRTAVLLAFTAVPLAALLGTAAGLAAGYLGGRIDRGFLFLSDMINSLPGIMFMVIVVLILRSKWTPSLGSGLLTLVIGFASVAWVGLARLVRAATLQLRSQLFVEAAVGIGATRWRILTRHLLPNLRHMIMVWIINTVPAVILMEAVLGYIGVGVTRAVDGNEFTVVSWGGMFFSGRSLLRLNPYALIVPSVCILLISMSFILLGDYLSGHDRRE